MSKVEKFKELLEGLEYTGELIGRSTTLTELEVHMPKKIRLEKELIKMYDEKQEKPVIRCKEYEVNYIGEENCIGQMQDRYEIHWQGKNCWQLNTSEQIEEKDGILTTDDFIFIKE